MGRQMKKIQCSFLLFIFFFFGCKSSILDDPSTVINYSIAERSHVKLMVENMYNTIVATLVDQELNAGYYSADFNSDNLAEGIYFFTLEARGLENSSYYKNTKQILLVK